MRAAKNPNYAMVEDEWATLNLGGDKTRDFLPGPAIPPLSAKHLPEREDITLPHQSNI